MLPLFHARVALHRKARRPAPSRAYRVRTRRAEAWEERVIGVSFDGTGYGDDGSIWGGEFFAGSVTEGFRRVMHLRTAALPGGDASARYPVQCAAGFLSQIDGLPALTDPPFCFPRRYQDALQLIDKKIRTFETTSVGRLFDAAAASTRIHSRDQLRGPGRHVAGTARAR